MIIYGEKNGLQLITKKIITIHYNVYRQRLCNAIETFFSLLVSENLPSDQEKLISQMSPNLHNPYNAAVVFQNVPNFTFVVDSVFDSVFE